MNRGSTENLYTEKMSQIKRPSLPEDMEPVILKNGDCNVTMARVKKQRSRYMMDLYTTIVDAQWRYTLFIFISGFTLSWLFFGFIWYVIARVHGDDLDDGDLDRKPCVDNVKTFTGAFLFSLESQHTIGYGVRAVTEECPAAIWILCVQSITGVILQAFMAGVVFAKLTRSKARANTLLFSRKAVVCLRDNRLVLMVKVADLRKSLIVGANVKARLIRSRCTQEGEEISFHMSKVKVGSDDFSEDLLFIWPVTIVHVIDQDSPFYTMDAASMLNEKFELVVYLEGTSESTGTTMQARYSYRNGDVLWGHRFQSAISYDPSSLNYVIDFEKFEKTISVATPLISARDWEVVQQSEGTSPPALTGGDQLVIFDPNVFSTTSHLLPNDQSQASSWQQQQNALNRNNNNNNFLTLGENEDSRTQGPASERPANITSTMRTSQPAVHAGYQALQVAGDVGSNEMESQRTNVPSAKM